MRKIFFFVLALFVATTVFAQEPATFEDLQLGSDGIWQAPVGENDMPSGGWLFANFTEYGYWGGFTASNRTDISQSGLSAQYTAITAGGHDGSAQYAVAYTYGLPTAVYAADGLTHTVTGCYVTNNLWAYQHMLEGESGVTPFGGTSGDDPDYFVLTATGKDSNGETIGELEFYLADYRFDDPEDDYVLNTWEWFDLSSLGPVASISFDLWSTKGNYGGFITPAYFCMDDFNGVAPSDNDEPPYVVNPVQDVVFDEYPQTLQVNLNGVVIDPDDPDEQITYSIEDNSNPSALTATLNEDVLTLTRQNADQATTDLTMRATSDGQSVDFNVHVIINAVIDEPPYIINLVPEVVMNEFPKIVHIDLEGVATDPDDPDELIEFALLSNSNEDALSATLNGTDLMLERQIEEEAVADVTLRATSDGQFVDFVIRVIMNHVEGVGDNMANFVAYPNPTCGLLNLSVADAQRFDYEIYNALGQIVMNGGVVGQQTCVDMGTCPKGVYFVSVLWDGNRLFQKVIVR